MLCSTALQATASRSFSESEQRSSDRSRGSKTIPRQTVAQDVTLTARSAEDRVQSGSADVQNPRHLDAVVPPSPYPGPTERGKKGKGSPYSIAERRVSELIPVLGSQLADDVSHKPSGRLPLLFARPAVTLATLNRAATNFAAW